MSSKWTRRGGLAAMLGGIVGILYAPFYALAYFATPDGAESLEAPWVAAWAGAVRPALEPLLIFAPPEVVYLTYGKFFSLMVLGWMAGLLALHARQAANAGRLEKWGFRAAFTGTVLGTLGGIGAYWIGTFWWAAVGISFGAFLVPALLLFGVGFPLFGIGTLRAKVAPQPGAWLLIVGGLPGMILLDIVLGQLSLGPEIAATGAYLADGGMRVLAGVLLLLGLVGLYARQSEATGALGLVAFLVAFVGTALILGTWWTNAFVAPSLATDAPAFLEAGPTGVLGVAYTLSFALAALGWLMFGVVSLRTRVYPRAAVAVLIVSAVLTLAQLPGTQVIFEVAVAWLGLALFSRKEASAGQPERVK
ncbi:MAG: hypothetical protein LC781_15380 [Actinobacteria bacterium]|nr:hypothetical protein [Actinomycetota bacterium]